MEELTFLADIDGIPFPLQRLIQQVQLCVARGLTDLAIISCRNLVEAAVLEDSIN